jgi:pimeloyl-ACP methyl ester carboxylesterase
VPLLRIHDGGRLRVRELGKRHGGTPVILVHGAGMQSAAWLPIMYRLAARGRHVVAVDLPGHGRSTGLARDVNALRDGLGLAAATLCLPPSILVGHSLGARVVLAAQAAWPDKVAALSLVTPALGAGDNDPRDALEWPRVLARTAYAPGVSHERRRRGAQLAALASCAQTAADLAMLRRAWPLAPLPIPAQVIIAAEDPLVDAARSASAAATLGAELVRLPGGHLPMQEAPDALCAALARLFTPSP